MTFLYASPGFQRELGYDPVVLRQQGIDLVKVRNERGQDIDRSL